MRTELEVQDRIRYLLTLEVDRRVAEASARLPHLCRHNRRHPLDVRKEVAGEENEQYNRIAGKSLPVIGLCMLGAEDPTSWPGTICEDPIDAKRCPYFSSVLSKALLEEQFKGELRDLEWVSANLPEVYGLLWALGSEMVPRLPWWKALLFRLLQIRPEPLVRAAPALLPPEG
jgi:hypothetical protein